jgi:outer membrane protein insertion porin family
MFRPGDVINTQKIRTAELRLKRSSLFCTDPAKGQVPKITFSPPGEEEDDTGVADRPQAGGRHARGQSPDDTPDVKKLDMHVFVNLNPNAPAGPDEPLGAAPVEPEPSTQKASWWPLRSRAAPPAPSPTAPNQNAPNQPAPKPTAPKWWPLHSSTDLPPLEIAADEVLIVRGQGSDNAVNGAGSGNALPPPRIHNSAPPPSSTATNTQPAATQAAKGLTATLASLNLTGPVSLGQSLGAARAAQASSTNLNLAGFETPALGQSSGGAAASPPAGASAPAPKRTSQAAQNTTGSNGGVSNGAVSSGAGSASPAAPWTVRGQYGGRMVQPLSPGPQSPPNYASGGTTSGYGGNVAFQSPGGTMGPPQFNQPLEGMPTDPTAPEEPDEALPALPINVNTEETQTGRFMFGVGVNSNAGLVGSIVVDEQNFDWQRWPTGAESWRNGTAFRGRGQHFRIELAPGTQMSRYLVSFNNPYLFDTNVSYGMSAYYFQRFYYDWYEQRMGGKVNLGYQFRPDLVGTIGLGAENVRVEDPRILIPDLAQVLGNNGRFSVTLGLMNDTRDNTFFPTEGRMINIQYEQVTGSFTYPRITLDMRKYFVLHQRADGSGRQVLALYSYTGVTGANTPIYDRFFMGGIGTVRGFYYRDASPTYDTVVDGGDFESFGTIEYTVPVTADDMFRLAMFVDGGFDSRTALVEGNDIRIAPGIGIRVAVPAMGPAPIAVDFAFPVVKNVHDQNQVVNFAVGVAR